MTGRLRFIHHVIWLLMVTTIGLQILGHKIGLNAFLALSMCLFVLTLGLCGLHAYARRNDDRLSDADRKFFTEATTLYQFKRRTTWAANSFTVLFLLLFTLLLTLDPFGHEVTMASMKFGLALLLCGIFVSYSVRCYRAYGRVSFALLPILTLILLFTAGIVLFEPWPMWRLWLYVDQSYLLFILVLGVFGLQSVQRMWEERIMQNRET